ncbi:DHA2 family efflux MFS transporter permease subunit [Paenibacillus oenotherae]|uniref:DHA2 family efflux MFS transporter permease subunit n=2 Tax=Paenibacillus oenotherae TaxID=1435645 RepID=A0ABS7D1V0_9BACL|nr:DHA2 family efflux MFS transporter permease subunit [Paenibacillus oenotherae]
MSLFLISSIRGVIALTTAAVHKDDLTLTHYWPVLCILIAGSFISIYNICSMNVSLPSFIRIFHSDLATVQWLMTGFTLTTGVITPLSGYLGDRFSNKHLFLFSIAGLLISSILCAISWNIYSLVCFRMLQGLFCGLIQPVTLTIIFQVVPQHKRTMAVSLWSASTILGPALAPTISGWLMEHNWHWMFLVLVPLCLLTLFMGWRVIPFYRTRIPGAMDGLGLAYAVVGSLSLLFFLGKVHEWGWASWRSLGFLAVGIVSLLLFIRQELRTKEPLLQLRLFRNRIFTASISVSAVLLIVGLYSGIYFIPLYLQEIHQMSPFHVGLLLLLPSLTLGVATIASGYWYERIGPLRLVLAGAVLVVLASWKFSFLELDTSYSYVALWMAVRYIGVGLSMTPAMNAGMRAVPAEFYSHASALINWLRQIFGALALGLFTSIFYTRMDTHTTALQQSTPSESVQWIQSTAYTLSIDDAFMFAAIFAVAGLPLALLLRRSLTSPS